MKRELLASLIAAAGMASGAASATVINYNDGVNNFNFDEIVVSTVGTSTVTVTDDGDGVLDPIAGSGDTFLETGLVFAFGFKLGGLPVFGQPTGYEILASYTPPAGSFSGTVGLSGLDGIVLFSTGSSMTIYRDTTVNGAVDGTATVLGTATLTSGDCVLTGASNLAEGSCELNFQYNANPGILSWNGIDLSLLSFIGLNVDLNIDELVPPLSPVFDASGEQVLALTHDGSARFSVPEPGSLALAGLGLLGLAAFRRRKA